MSPITITRRGHVATVTVDNPPVNAISHQIRQGLLDAFSALARDPSIQRIILSGSNSRFPAGADIRELDCPPLDPALREVAAAIEAAPQIVVAAIEGGALGGGLELALACDRRISSSSAVLGFPEVKLGIIPGGGGTQRLPRLIGVESAIDVIVSARSLTAAAAKSIGLVDRIAENPEEEAFGGDRVLGKRKLSDLSLSTFAEGDASGEVVAKVKGQRAAEAAVDAIVTGAREGFEVGLARERTLFLELRDSFEAAALRHLFFAEREAPKVEGARRGGRAVSNVAVVGIGTMGSGIAVALAVAGYDVVVTDQTPEAIAGGLGRIDDIFARSLGSGKMREDEIREHRSHIHGANALAQLGDADVIVEAAFEDWDVKRDLFRRLDAVAKPGAILASNTSFLDIDRLAAETSRPRDVLGLHFFSPAHIMRLLEIVRGRETSAEALATAFGVAKRLGKLAVVAGVCDGFIANRVGQVYRRECEFMLEEGCYPDEVDAAMRAFGFTMGPFAVADLAGLDISWARRKRLSSTRPPDERYVRIADLLCEAGRFGQKTGVGWHRYDKGDRKPLPDEEVRRVINGESERKGILRRAFAVEEIQRRAVYSLVNEAANVVADGIVQRPSDIDVVMVNGFGFPRSLGGPFFWAANQPADGIMRGLDEVAAAAGIGHRPAQNIEAILAPLRRANLRR